MAPSSHSWRKKTPTTLPETGFLRLRDVLHFYPVSRSTWYAGVRAKRFPQPVKLGPNTTAWRAEDVHALIEAAGAAEVAA